MGSRIENLGDYNKARIALQEAGGNWDTLYKSIGDTEVAKAAPGIMAKGVVIGAAAISGLYGLYLVGKKAVVYMKNRKQLIENEPELRKQFEEAVSDTSTASEQQIIETGGNDNGTETE